MVQVRRSTVIDAPIDAVWGMLRDFNGHERWHPAVAESRIEEGRRPDEIGCVRRFRLTSGGELREQLRHDHVHLIEIYDQFFQLVGQPVDPVENVENTSN